MDNKKQDQVETPEIETTALTMWLRLFGLFIFAGGIITGLSLRVPYSFMGETDWTLIMGIWLGGLLSCTLLWALAQIIELLGSIKKNTKHKEGYKESE